MEKRLTYQCWHCRREYMLYREVAPEQKILIACPYCGKKAVVDFTPYSSRPIPVYRDAEGNSPSAPAELHLPDVLPTREPDEETS